MKPGAWAILLAVVLVTCALPASGQINPLTLDQAREKVSAFAHVPVSEVALWITRQAVGHTVYRFKLPNGDVYACYPNSGDVAAYYTSNESPRQSTEEIAAARLPVADLEKVARQTMRDRFAGANTMRMFLLKRHFDGACYNFSFVQELPENGARTENSCHIAVGADTGKIVSYFDHVEEVPAEADRKPKLRADQIPAIAAWATQSVSLLGADEPELWFSRGNLHWSIRIRGVKASGSVGAHAVRVDADTGGVLDVGTYGLATYPQPPNNHVMLAGNVLASSLGPMKHAGALLVSERIVAALGGRILRAPGSTAIVGEKTVKVSAGDMAIRSGLTFVAPGAVAKAFPGAVLAVDVDAKRTAVNFICDGRSARMWLNEHRVRRALPVRDRSALVAAAAQRTGLVASADELKREAPKRPEILNKLQGRNAATILTAAGAAAVVLCSAAGVVRHRRGLAAARR